MTKLNGLFAMIIVSMFLFSIPAFSKCMSGNGWRDNGKVMYVCVKGDSFADRKKGKKVCEKVMKKSCSTPSTFSSSCSGGTCYDVNGKKHSYLRGF